MFGMSPTLRAVKDVKVLIITVMIKHGVSWMRYLYQEIGVLHLIIKAFNCIKQNPIAMLTLAGRLDLMQKQKRVSLTTLQ